MANIRNMFSIKAVCTAVMLSVFSITAASPASIQVDYAANPPINEAVTIYKVKKIIQEIKKLPESEKSKDAIDVMLEMKHLIEQQTGIAVNMEEALAKTKKEMKEKGHKLDKKQWKSFEKAIEKRASKFKARLFYIDTLNSSGLEFNENEFQSFYEKHYYNEQDDLEENGMTFRITLGVTLVLSGFFVMRVPLPYCGIVGLRLIQTGVGVLGWEGVEVVNNLVYE